ncbi:Phosphoglycerate mutase-like protein AT74 (At-74) [Durusdinium trenchii]|uniref:Phosphoglycerate mutase-like protein AT74 (At-74) n=1 Tax=Durusdinium trenchii TaxID=1381693 RepID=A0ABP0SNB2_9DINO
MRKCLGAVLGLALLFAPRLFVPSWTPRGAAQTNRAPKRRAVPAGRASGRSKAVQSVLQEVTRMGPEDLERLVEELLPTLNTKRRLLRDRLRPRRIILVRHGESVGNRDKTAYQHTPDSKIELTPLGELQGAAAGQQIRTLVGNGTVRFFYSPYMRTRQTLQEILKAFKGQQIEMCAEPRLREQDFGNFQDAQQMELVYRERQKFGRFYYRFPNGEAGTDVFDRVSDFWSSLLRSMDTSPVENLVLVTHGLLMRIFCMVYFHWTVEEFEEVWNPSNCEVWALEKNFNVGGYSNYRLAGRWRPSPLGGSFREIRFGEKRNQPLWNHMKSRRGPRVLTPGDESILDDPMYAHLASELGPGQRVLGSPRPDRRADKVEVSSDEEPAPSLTKANVARFSAAAAAAAGVVEPPDVDPDIGSVSPISTPGVFPWQAEKKTTKKKRADSPRSTQAHKKRKGDAGKSKAPKKLLLSGPGGAWRFVRGLESGGPDVE